MESRQPNSKGAATTTTCNSSSPLRKETQTFKVLVPFPRQASRSRSWSLGNSWWSNAVTTNPCRRLWSTAQISCNSNHLTPYLPLSAAAAALWISTTTITSNNLSTTCNLAMAASLAPTLATAVALLPNNNSSIQVWAQMQIHLSQWTLWWIS